jgi:hypothetical protein
MDELTQGDAGFAELARSSMSKQQDMAPPATFSVEAFYDEAKSKEKGRPVYVDTDIIEIRIGRDVVRRPVTDADKRTYAAKYEAFKRSESQEAVEGFPLSQWAAIPGKAVVKEFAHYGIRTVEELAAATDSTIQLVGPHMALRQQARDWVSEAKKSAPLLKLRAENDEMRNRIASLERMMAKQTQEIESARMNGGTLPGPVASPAENGRLAAIEAMMADLIAQKAGPGQVNAGKVDAPGEPKMNKDGTPRKKPGPKPKGQEN